MRFYRDAKSIKAYAFSRKIAENLARLRLGRDWGAAFPGAVDDFVFYDRPLGPQELLQLGRRAQ